MQGRQGEFPGAAQEYVNQIKHVTVPDKETTLKYQHTDWKCSKVNSFHYQSLELAH